MAAAVIFCLKCGSELVDVRSWEGNTATITCFNCYHGAKVRGFTLGRVTLPQGLLTEARKDKAVNEAEGRD